MNEYQRRVLEGRKEFLKLAQKQEKELLKIYEEAGRQVSYKLSKAKPGGLTARYLGELDKSIDRYILELKTNLSKSIKNGIEASSQIASAVQLSYFDMVAPREDIRSTFNKMFTQLPSDITKKLISNNYYSDGKTLDKRLWDITKKNARDIDALIKVNIASGANAKELAKELEIYINPLSRIAPKTLEAGMGSKISYQSQRLARTSLTHANTESYIQGAKMNPFSKGLKWNLSPSHSERMHGKKDICDEYAGQIFKPNEAPVQHPNCLCYLTQEVMDTNKARNELIDWVNGEDNLKLDKWLEAYSKEFGIDRNKSKYFNRLAVSKYGKSGTIKDKKVANFVNELKALDVTKYDSRRKLGHEILKTLDLNDIKVSVKAISENGYCLIGNKNGNSNVIEYVLNSKDLRNNNYKIKTAFHEAYHAKANGMKTDYHIIKSKWLDIEETFAETSAHFLTGKIGITEEISPAYAERLVNILPRLKQVDKFKDCNKFKDFGEVAWTDRLNGVNPEWEDLYNRCMKIDHNLGKYSQQYIPYINKNKEDLVGVMLNNMPSYSKYKDQMINDCEEAINSMETGKSLSGNQKMVFKNILAITMNRLGVK